MTKMATTPIYGKNPLKIFLSRTRRLMILGHGIKHWGCWPYQVFTNGYCGLTLTYFTARSTVFQSCRDRSSWVEPVLSRGKVSCSRTQCSASGEARTRNLSISSQALYHSAHHNTQLVLDVLITLYELPFQVNPVV